MTTITLILHVPKNIVASLIFKARGCCMHVFLVSNFMISVCAWPESYTAFDQSEHALYACYFTQLFYI